jgi:hypothetical protein
MGAAAALGSSQAALFYTKRLNPQRFRRNGGSRE